MYGKAELEAGEYALSGAGGVKGRAKSLIL